MTKVQAIIDLSEDLYAFLAAHGFSKEIIAKESRMLFALKCYRQKLLSLGKAAELAGLSKWDFIEFASQNHIPAIDHDEVNLKREFDSAKALVEELKG